jgi:hypothetical protein
VGGEVSLGRVIGSKVSATVIVLYIPISRKVQYKETNILSTPFVHEITAALLSSLFRICSIEKKTNLRTGGARYTKQTATIYASQKQTKKPKDKQMRKMKTKMNL